MLKAADTLDGYTLHRRIGAGGFGEVWLASISALDQFVALKAVTSPKAAQRELAAVRRFKELAARVPGLIGIEHVGLLPEGFFYVMPLADGPDGLDPKDELWSPKTLGTLLKSSRESGAAPWASGQIRAWLSEITRAAAGLEREGLVHRDIKPDNILFVKGRPVLSDISLLSEEREGLTEIGTPGFRAPSWFTDTGGNPDAYGIAATMFTALTWHAPDKLGRAAYRWPPGGEASLNAGEREEWLRLHRIIFRATHEKSNERYRNLGELADEIEGVTKPSPIKPSRQKTQIKVAAYGILILLCAAAYQISSSGRLGFGPSREQREQANLGVRDMIVQLEHLRAIKRTMAQKADSHDEWLVLAKELTGGMQAAIHLHQSLRVLHMTHTAAIQAALRDMAKSREGFPSRYESIAKDSNAETAGYNFLTSTYGCLENELFLPALDEKLQLESLAQQQRDEQLMKLQTAKTSGLKPTTSGGEEMAVMELFKKRTQDLDAVMKNIEGLADRLRAY